MTEKSPPEHRTVSEGDNAYGSYTFDAALAEIERLGRVCEQHLAEIDRLRAEVARATIRFDRAEARLSAQPSAVQELEGLKALINTHWPDVSFDLDSITDDINARLTRLRQEG